jgi:hypothetical protein
MTIAKGSICAAMMLATGTCASFDEMPKPIFDVQTAATTETHARCDIFKVGSA